MGGEIDVKISLASLIIVRSDHVVVAGDPWLCEEMKECCVKQTHHVCPCKQEWALCWVEVASTISFPCNYKVLAHENLKFTHVAPIQMLVLACCTIEMLQFHEQVNLFVYTKPFLL